MALAVGFYGKLPAFEDFIKSDSWSGSISEYRDWFDDAFDHLVRKMGESFSEEFPSLPRLGSVVKAGDAKRPIVCLSMPSNDTSGRIAPFNLLAEAPSSMLKKALLLIPDAYWMFCQIGIRAMENPENAFGFDMQRNTVWKLQEGVPLNESRSAGRYSAYLKNTALETFLESYNTLSSKTDGQQVFRTVFSALAPTRDSFSESFQAVLRFPLFFPVDDRGLEMAFWTNFAQTVLGVRLKNLSLFWTEDHFDIAFRTPDERLLALAWLPGIEDDSIWDFCTMDLSSDEAEDNRRIRFDDLLRQKEQSLESFLSGTADIMK